MRRLLSIALVIAACWASAAQAHGIHDLAPADEYFGRLKMSVLGIKNSLDGLERRASYGDRNVPAMSGQLAMVDDAMLDWRAKYPRYTWLPRFYRARARVVSLIAAAAGGRRFTTAGLRGVSPNRN